MNKKLNSLKDANEIIDRLVKLVRVRMLMTLVANVILFDIFVFWLFYLRPIDLLSMDSNTFILMISNQYIVTTLIVLSVIFIYFVVKSERYHHLNKNNILEHINRELPHYQESCQIVSARTTGNLRGLLQAKVAEQLICDDKKNILIRVMPILKWKLPLSFTMVLIVGLLNTGNIKVSIYSLYSMNQNVDKTDSKNESFKASKKLILTKIKIENIKLEVTPPIYTKKPNENFETLNVSVLEGSLITWNISFNAKIDRAFIKFSSNEIDSSLKTNAKDSTEFESVKKVEMHYNSKLNIYSLTKTVSETQIYNIETIRDEIPLSEKENTRFNIIDGVYSIAIIKDQPPKIKIVTPKISLTEFPKENDGSFLLTADISDDYGLSNVKILASVAKGSGEAVKFRDKILQFDDFVRNIKASKKGASHRYTKQFELDKLDMEPGDEVYFQVEATDNRPNKAQKTKSNSVIVRWLDNDEIEMSAEGIRIGFVAEFFRSQRQIIIETLELIEDRNDLVPEVFSERSVDLGHSQNDLKIKYGQYLGDEFGEGAEARHSFSGNSLGLADGYHGDSEVNDAGTTQIHDIDDEDHKDENVLENQHEHTESDASSKFGDANALIAEFAHNHRTEEVAPLSKRDPKSWMKMAVSEMWQAELHLMLSEPAKALPFERKAYNYLKEARKADRIYAKRLGFEPPPVTEDRRLTGELNDVNSNFINKRGYIDSKSNQITIRAVYTMINRWKLLSEYRQNEYMLSDEDLKTVSLLKNHVLELTKKRPVLIKYVAILEQVGLSKKWSLIQCTNCLIELQQRLWSLMTAPRSLPNVINLSRGMSIEAEKRFVKEIRILLNSKIAKKKDISSE